MTALVMALMVAGATLMSVPAATPALAAGCYDTSCTGQNPIDTGCVAGAETLYSFVTADEVEVDLRYSPACDAYWAKEQDYGQDPPGELEVAGRVCSGGGDGIPLHCRVAVYQTSWDDGFGNNIFTLMIPGDYWARACWAVYGSSWACSP